VSGHGWTAIGLGSVGVRPASVGVIDYTALGIEVTVCLAGSGSVATKMRCAFNAILAAASRTPEAEAMLYAAATSTCSGFLSSVGIPSSGASLVCAPLASWWERFGQWASDELVAIYRSRGWLRTSAEGGGRTLVDATGAVVAVECSTSLDADGRPVLIETSGSCPAAAFMRRDAPPLPPMDSLKLPPPPPPPAKSAVSPVVIVGGLGVAAVLAWLLLA
jgi:hypothetical protein